MNTIDWRELYASNQAAIARASGAPGATAPPALPSALRVPAAPPALPAALRLPTPPPAGLPAALRLPTAPAGLPGALRLPAALRRAPRHAAPQHGGALVHLPAGVDRDTAVPLVCMLHGCTQDPESFAAATQMNAAADRHGFAVVYPRQPPGGNPQRCWNWFLPEHQERGRGEAGAIAAEVQRIAAGGAGQKVDAGRVFVAGLSSGGAMAAIVAFTHPDLFAAVAVHSGVALGSAESMPAAFAVMAGGAQDPTMLGPAAHAAMGERARRVPGMVVHGDADPTVAPVNGDQVLGQLMHANRLAAPGAPDHDPDQPSEVVRGGVDGGRAYTRARWTGADGAVVHERLTVHGMGHAWSGGLPGGSYTDPQGPDATEAIRRFFAEAVPGD